MDSIYQTFIDGDRVWRNVNFKKLAAEIHKTIEMFATRYNTFERGSRFMPAEVLYQLYTSAFFLREKCEKLTPMLGMTDPAAEKFVERYYELTANMRLIDERRHALLTWGEMVTTKYRVRYDKMSYLHEVMDLGAKRHICYIIEKCAAWRERYEEHQVAIEADTYLPRPKPQFLGEGGRDLIREKVDCSRDLTDVLIKRTATQVFDREALQRRCNNFLDVTFDSIMQLGNEILQRQSPIRPIPHTDFEIEELTFLRVIMGKARTIAMLSERGKLDLASARVEASSLVKKIGESRALHHHCDIQQLAEEDALQFCGSVQGVLAAQSESEWCLDFLNAHERTAKPFSNIDTHLEVGNPTSLVSAGSKLILAILVEILSHTVGIRSEKEAQALQDIISAEAELSLDGLAQENALKLLQMFSTTFEASDFERLAPVESWADVSWS